MSIDDWLILGAVPEGSSHEEAAESSRWKMFAAMGCGFVALMCFGCSMCAGWIGYKEEGVEFGEPGEEVMSVPVKAGEPFTLRFDWDGIGYAHHDIWLDMDVVSKGEVGFKGEFACSRGSRPKGEPIKVGRYPFTEARRVQTGQDKFSLWLRVESEYSRSSSAPYECWGNIDADPGEIARARVVVTRIQRPSDMIAR